MKKFLFIFLVYSVLQICDLNAQGPTPPPGGGGGGGGSGTDAPIDNDILLLLLGAAFFGTYKLSKNKKGVLISVFYPGTKNS